MALNTVVSIDIVFSEVQLPDQIGGFLLANLVRQTYPSIDVILTSSVAGAAENSAELCEEAPTGKPYHPTVLLMRIRFGDKENPYHGGDPASRRHYERHT